MSSSEKRELERMESTIEKAEAAIAAIEAELADPVIQSDGVRLEEACKRLAAAQDHLDSSYIRWGELEAKASQA